MISNMLTIITLVNGSFKKSDYKELIFNKLNSESILIKSNNLITNFSKVRNSAISKAKGNWILMLDVDENLSREALTIIPKLLNNIDIDGYWFRRKNFITSVKYLKFGLFYPDWQLRLFRNKKNYYYFGSVHEQLNIPHDKMSQIAVDILHHPTIPKYTKFSDFKNFKPYIKIARYELAELHKSKIWYVLEGANKFLSLFFGGFFRGKGIYDGIPGFRAHLMFAASVSLPYFLVLFKINENR